MKNKLFLGLVLILLGFFFLLRIHISDNFSLFLLLAGIFFLILYVITKIYGILIPGGILTGLGLGLIYQGKSSSIFFIFLGCGFLLIYLLGFMKGKSHPWPLIPGGILLGIGVYEELLLRNIIPYDFIKTISPYWPVILIIIGLYLILKKK